MKLNETHQKNVDAVIRKSTEQDPGDLPGTARRFEKVLEDYKREYEKIGLPVRSYPDVDCFGADYLSGDD